jgi:hypothetical protein
MVTRVIRRGKQHFCCDSCKNDTKTLRALIVCSALLLEQDQALKGGPPWRFPSAKDVGARFTGRPPDALTARYNAPTPQSGEELRRWLAV